MSTTNKETEKPRDKQEEPRTKGGVTQEDRSKSLGSANSASPFDGAQAKPKRKE